MIDERQKFELGTLWLDGVNTSVSPVAVPDRQFVWGVNIDNTGGQISTRPGFRQIYQTGDGKCQMLAHFRSSNDTDYVIMGVNGRIIASLSPWEIFMDLGVQLDPSADFFTHCEVVRGTCRVVEEDEDFEEGDRVTVGMRNKLATRRYIIISDGVNPPVYFDGASIKQSDEQKFGIPKCTWMAYAKDRLWVYDPRDKAIKWSDINDPLTFYTEGFLANGGSISLDGPCTGLAALPDLGGDILAFERDKTWVINASAAIKVEGDWKKMPKFVRCLFPHVGCIAGKSFTTHYGDLWWWSNTGLTSLRRAQNSIEDSELNPSDLEMTRSRKTFGSGKNEVTGVSHENYFLMAMPNGDTWVKNNSPASLLNTDTSPAWIGVWTGIQPKEFCTFVRKSDGERFTLALSSDKDGHNRLWRLFRDVKEDNSGRISCSVEFKLHPFGGLYLEKRFLNFSTKLRDLWGNISLQGFYRGVRGSWKQILSKEIKVADARDANDNPITQTRTVTSSEAAHYQGGCEGACGESGRTENVDGAFQILLKWDGELSIESYQSTAMIDAGQDFFGRCEKDEEIAVMPDACEDPTTIDYTPPYREQTNYNFNLQATIPTIKCTAPPGPGGDDEIDWDIISIEPTPTPNIPDIPVIIIIPDDNPIRTYTATQSATANCVNGTGEPVTREASYTSSISQTDADDQARAIAQALAEADLVCTWSATKTVTVQCPSPTIGQPSSATASYSSTISQEDADEQATELATIAANAGLSCTPPPSDTFFFIGRNDSTFAQNEYPGRIDSGGETPADTGVLWTGSRSIKTHGSAGIVDITGAPLDSWEGGVGPLGPVQSIGPSWICGGFTHYNNIPRKGLAKVNNVGALDTDVPDLFATPVGQPALSNTITSHLEGMDGFVAISGTMRSFNGVSLGGTYTYLLFNPATLAVVNASQQYQLLAHDNLHRRYFGAFGKNFVRISQAGVTDATFLVDPETNGPNNEVKSIAIDFFAGFIYCAGLFTTWGGVPTPAGICRVAMDTGYIDTSFNVPPTLGIQTPVPIGATFGQIALERDGNGEVTYIYAPALHVGTGTSRIVKLRPDGSPDTRFMSPSNMQRVTLAIKAGYLVVMATGGFPRANNTGNFWTSSPDDVTSTPLARNYVLFLNRDDGSIFWPFNNDNTYIAPPGYDTTTSNPGYFNGPITGIR